MNTSENAVSSPSLKGEYFNSRGLGTDYGLNCFICDTRPTHGLLHNIAAFVRTKESGELIVRAFRYGARLDYRTDEPNWIQVKVGSCGIHLPALVLLDRSVRESCVITEELIVLVRNKIIDLEEHGRRTRVKARELYQLRELSRRQDDWNKAVTLLTKFGRPPSYEEISKEAYVFYVRARHARAIEDWLDGERTAALQTDLFLN